MSASQRTKGQVGERELFALLSHELGIVVRRNVDQARNGGADGIEIPGWAVEVKRQETNWKSAWWEQADAQAQALGRKPILFYRASRRPWCATVSLYTLAPAIFPVRPLDGDAVAHLSFRDACTLIRESLK